MANPEFPNTDKPGDVKNKDKEKGKGGGTQVQNPPRAQPDLERTPEIDTDKDVEKDIPNIDPDVEEAGDEDVQKKGKIGTNDTSRSRLP